MKYKNKSLINLLTVTLIFTILFAAVPLVKGADPDATQLVAQINAISGLTASVDGGDPNVVNVVGGVYSGALQLSLVVGSDITIKWGAAYLGTVNHPLVFLTGSGVFEVGPGGWIANSGSGNTINSNDVKIVVTGLSAAACGVVQAFTSTAIMGAGPTMTVTVEGFGSVFGDETSNLQPVINMNNPLNTADNVFVRDNGSVYALSEDSYGYAIQTYGNVKVDGGTIYTRATNGRAINLVGYDSIAKINGGKVYADGTNGVAISTATSDPSQVVRASVIVTGGIVSAGGPTTSTSSFAIRTTGTDASITITGGIVSATNANAIRAQGPIPVQISGGLVFAYGSAIAGANNVIHLVGSGTPAISDKGIVIAWDRSAGSPFVYAEGSSPVLIVSAGSSATWHNDAGRNGISYANSDNTGFFPLNDVTVTSDYGLIFDTSSGKMYLDVLHSGTIAGNLEYNNGKGVTWSGTVGNLVLNDFSWSTSASVALKVLGLTEISINGVNKFTSTNITEKSYGIQLTADTVIIGPGIIEAHSGNTNNQISHGLTTTGSLTVKNAIINACGGSSLDESIGISVGDSLIITDGFVDATSGSATSSIGVHVITDSITLNSGGITTQGESVALLTSQPIVLPDAYTYWTNIFAINPGTVGTLYYPNSNTLEYIYNPSDQYVKIVSERIAAITDLTVTGIADTALSGSQQTTITLYADTTSDTLINTDISLWFNYIPNGISVKANSITGTNTITLAFEGTPTIPSTETFDITIPAHILTSNTNLNVQLNPDAKFNIAPAPLIFTYSSTYDIPASTVGIPITNINVFNGVSGGTQPYTFSATGLPNGIQINSTTGIISGIPTTPTTAGTATITVTDSTSPSDSKSITINFGTISPASSNGLTDDEEHTVTYNGNGHTGGTIPIDNRNPYTKGTQVTVMAQGSIIKTGYTFLGWSTNSTATVATYLPNSSFTITSDTTLYAVWTAINYTITYAPGTHGTFNPVNFTNIHYGTSTPNAPTATGETGWNFTGWLPNPNPTVTGNVTYIAQWTQLTTTTTPTPTTTPAPTLTPIPTSSTNPSISPSPTVSTTFTPFPSTTTSNDLDIKTNKEEKMSVVNLFISTSGIVLAIFASLYILLSYNKQHQNEQKFKQYNFFGIVTIITLAVVGIGVFLLTENLSLPFGWVTDKWTILNAAILTIETLTIGLWLKSTSQTSIRKQT